MSMSGTAKEDARFSTVSRETTSWVEVVPTSSPTLSRLSDTARHLFQNPPDQKILHAHGIALAAGV